MSAFCEPDTTASSSHSSVASGTAPRLEIASTATSAPVAFAAAASSRTSATAPVEVSECVRKTTFAPPIRSSASGRSSGAGLEPHSYARRSTVQPQVLAMSTQRSAKRPAETTRTRSPGRQRFATTDSIPPVPEAARSSTSEAVW